MIEFQVKFRHKFYIVYFELKDPVNTNYIITFWVQRPCTMMVQLINVFWYFTPYLSIINGYQMSSLEMLSELQLNLTMEVQIHKSNHYFYFSLLYFSFIFGLNKLLANGLNFKLRLPNTLKTIGAVSLISKVCWARLVNPTIQANTL